MKLLPPIIALIIVVLLANSAFIVKEGQSALLLQFGRIEGADANDTSDYKPGLHFKMPIVQQVVRYDRRILNLDAQPERYFTSEKKAVNVDFYVKWKIENGAAYYRSFGADELQLLANQRLGSIIKNSLRFEFNSRPLNELIASARSDITEKVIEQAARTDEFTRGRLPQPDAVQGAEDRIHNPFCQRAFVRVATIVGRDEIEPVRQHRTGEPLQPSWCDALDPGIEDHAGTGREIPGGSHDRP